MNAILQMRRLTAGRHDFVVFTSKAGNIRQLRTLEIAAERFADSARDKLAAFCATGVLGRYIQGKLRIRGKLEGILRAASVNLVYLVTPSPLCLSLQRLNYIVTIWDSAHLEMLEFPEVRSFNTFHHRDDLYRQMLGPAILTLTDSAALARRLSARYGLDRERLLVMPFAPTPFLDESISVGKGSALAKYGLQEGYFFYPSQLWAHKNHVRVLQALAALRRRDVSRTVVFTGHLREQVGDAALLVDPDDADALADAMVAVLDPETAQLSVRRGRVRLAHIHDRREKAEKDLSHLLGRFARRRECWA